MSKVHILPPEVISKISAGEVIERPASVLKELVENSLDAGTKTIELRLKNAGKDLIHLNDTGFGIDKDDLETVFERHSTSKIKTSDDLFNIHSLGFRGEALYSVAAISDITLRSKTSSQDSGWEIHLRAGKKISLKPVAMPNGTQIEVKELFFNTPARKKFLKTNATELNQILSTITPYALFYPGCRFLVTHENRTLLDLSPTKTQTERIAETLNLNPQHLLEVKETFAQEEFSVHMVLSDINLSRTRRDLQFIFINGRPVQSKTISFHLNDLYRLILPPNHYPCFCLFLKIPANHVDVNVHPTKREVKIQDEHHLMPLLRHLIEQTLMTHGKPKEIGRQSAGLSESNVLRRALATSAPDQNSISTALENPLPTPKASLTEQYTFPSEEKLTGNNFSSFANAGQSLAHKLSQARYLGSFISKFLLFESGRSLLIIDQHAAQERIVFESLIRQMDKGKVEVQNLLTPDLLKVSLTEMLTWEENKETLEKLGLTSTPFDKNTLAIHSTPALLSDPIRALRELLAGGNISRADHATLARRACRASIRAGDTLQPTQAEFQKQELLKCRDPFTCPHGRPTVIELGENFLDRQFFRT